MIKDNQFYVIPEMIFADHDLSASTKLLFAAIHSLSHRSPCTASNEYLSEMVGISVRALKPMLKTLEDKGYITRSIDAGKFRTLEANIRIDRGTNFTSELFSPVNKVPHEGGRKFTPTSAKSSPVTSEKSSPQIKKSNIEENKEKNKEKAVSKKFNFTKALIDLGADKDLAQGWIDVRAKKKAVNSEAAFNLFVSQSKQATAKGWKLNEILKELIIRNWQGLKADWLETKPHIMTTPKPKPQPAAAPTRRTPPPPPIISRNKPTMQELVNNLEPK